MKRHLTSVVLAALAVLTGCATTPEPVVEYIRPECQTPVAPNFQPPNWDDLLLPFHHIPIDSPDYQTYDDALTDLEHYEAQVVDYALELQAGYNALCNPAG